jgi:hypothetical protein
MSRSGYGDDKSKLVIKQITALGAHIDLLIADVTKPEEVTKAMQQTRVPIVGIIQGSMVLRVSQVSYTNTNSYKRLWHNPSQTFAH